MERAEVTRVSLPGRADGFKVALSYKGQPLEVPAASEEEAQAALAVLSAKASQLEGDPDWQCGLLELQPEWLDYIGGCSFTELVEALALEAAVDEEAMAEGGSPGTLDQPPQLMKRDGPAAGQPEDAPALAAAPEQHGAEATLEEGAPVIQGRGRQSAGTTGVHGVHKRKGDPYSKPSMHLVTPWGRLYLTVPNVKTGARLFDTALIWRTMRQAEGAHVAADGRPLMGSSLPAFRTEDLPPKMNYPIGNYTGDSELMDFLSKASFQELRGRLQREAEGVLGGPDEPGGNSSSGEEEGAVGDQQLEAPANTAMAEAQQPGTAQHLAASGGAAHAKLGLDAWAAGQPGEARRGAPEMPPNAAGVGTAGTAGQPALDAGPGQLQHAMHAGAAQEAGSGAGAPAEQPQQAAPQLQARMHPWTRFPWSALRPAASTGLFGVSPYKDGFRMQINTPFGELRVYGLRSAQKAAVLYDTALLWRETRRGKEDDLDEEGKPLEGAELLPPAPEDLPPRFNKPVQTYLGDAGLMAFLSQASYRELEAKLQQEMGNEAGEAGASDASGTGSDGVGGSMLEAQGGKSSRSSSRGNSEEEEEEEASAGAAGRHWGAHPKLKGVRQQASGRATARLYFQDNMQWLGVYDSASKAGCVHDVGVLWRALQLGKDPSRENFNYPHLGLAGDATLLAQLRALPDIPSLRAFLAGWAQSHLSAFMARLQSGGGGLPEPPSPALPAPSAAGGAVCESKGGKASSGAGADAAGTAGPPAKRARQHGGSHSVLPLQTPASASAGGQQPAAAALKASPGAAAAAAPNLGDPSNSMPAAAGPTDVQPAAAVPAAAPAPAAGPPSAYGMLDQLQPTLEALLPAAALLEFELAFPGFPPPKQRALWRAIQRAAGLGNTEAAGKLVQDAMQDGLG